MKKIIKLFINVFLCLIVSNCFSVAYAYKDYQNSFDNQYPDSSLVGNCQICHWPLTEYSNDWENAGKDFSAIELLDSDNDGFDNITEINAGTLPGDEDSSPDVNTPPVANNQEITTSMDNAVEIVLTGEDADNDTLTFEVNDEPENGFLSGDIPNLIYTPNGGFTGNDSFTFTVDDGNAVSDKATISIEVVGVDPPPDPNTPPVANSQEITTSMDNAVEIVLTGEDADNDTLAFEVNDEPENGFLSGDVPNLIYTPNDGFTGNDSFTFTVDDGNAVSDKATISIEVVGVDPPPDPDDYCESNGSDQSYEYIKQVVVGSFSNSSGAEGYGDFTSKIINMNPGESINITLTPEFISNAYTEYWTIWIDLNSDGDFEDSGEVVFEDYSISDATGSIEVKGSISIPLGTKFKQTRMRVSMQYSFFSDSCGTFNYGEVEDYTVDIGSSGL